MTKPLKEKPAHQVLL